MRHRLAPILLLLLALSACNDRRREPRPVTFDRTGPEDSGGGDASGPDFGPGDELCADGTTGASCELANGFGVCSFGTCRLVACEFGFSDCDDEPGCETDTTTVEACGACDSRCDDGSECQQGPDGWRCAAGTVCPRDRVDLDGEAGCEWHAVWDQQSTLVPPDLEVHAARGVPDGVLLAGVSEQGRASTRVAASPAPRGWSADTGEDVRAVAVFDAPAAVLWSDGLSIDVDAQEAWFALTCQEASVPRRYVAAPDLELVATQFELADLELEDCVGGAPCVGPRGIFGRAEYLRAFWPFDGGVGHPNGFDSAEIAQCDACMFDLATGEFAVSPGCVGPQQCRAVAFDESVCGGCTGAASCPEFRPVAALRLEDSMVVATARGFIVFDWTSTGWDPVLRVEEPFDPLVAGGPGFIDAILTEGAQPELLLIHSTGLVRRVALEQGAVGWQARPAGPDFALDVDPATSFFAAWGEESLAVVTVSGVLLVRLMPISVRAAWVPRDSQPGLDGLRPVAVVSDTLGFDVIYVAPGIAWQRTIRLE